VTGGGSPGPDWVRDAVFYQIFPDRFASSVRVPKPGALEPWDAPPTRHGFKGGDLLGIVDHLDDLQDLGVTALYLNPILASTANHRYHTYDFELVDPLLGGDAAFTELLDAVHGRGMRLILDGVFNHASRGFWPFSHVLENGAASPYRDWFYLSPDVLAGKRRLVAYPGSAEAEAIARLREERAAIPPAPPPGGGRVPSLSETIFGYEGWWDLPALPKLNHSNPAVREYIYNVGQRWLRLGADGWRLDVPEEITEPGFWEEFRRRCLEVRPEAYLVGEIWYPAAEWLGGARFDGLMNYPLAEAILSYVGATTLDTALISRTHEFSRHVHAIDGPAFGRQLTQAMTTYEPAVATLQLNLLDSHDTPRFLSMAGGDVSAQRLAALIQMTLPGAPCIYYGDEVGLAGREDPDCRRGYPWDPARQDSELREAYRRLIALRRAEPALRRGRFEVLAAEGSTVAYALFGATADDAGPGGAPGPDLSEAAHSSIVVVINAGQSPASLELDHPELANHRVEQVSWSGRERGTESALRPLEAGKLSVSMAPRDATVVGVRPAL
jgi:cyclomaltodextrinase